MKRINVLDGWGILCFIFLGTTTVGQCNIPGPRPQTENMMFFGSRPPIWVSYGSLSSSTDMGVVWFFVLVHRYGCRMVLRPRPSIWVSYGSSSSSTDVGVVWFLRPRPPMWVFVLIYDLIFVFVFDFDFCFPLWCVFFFCCYILLRLN